MKLAIVSIVALALALPAVAAADPGKGHGKHGAKAASSAHPGKAAAHGKAGARGHKAVADGTWTPPGLAKKPYAMAPGQAKKTWSQGDRLPTKYYTQQRYRAPAASQSQLGVAPEGSRWVQVGGNYYLTRTDTGIVSQMVSMLR